MLVVHAQWWDLDATQWLSVIQILLTLPIAFYVAMASRTFSLMQGERDVRSAWMTFDMAVVSDKDLFPLIDQRLEPSGRAAFGWEDAEARWRWTCYAIRNPLENFYMALQRRHHFWWSRPICRDPAYLALHSSLQELVKDDQFMDTVRGYSADFRFAWLCRAIRVGGQCDFRPDGASWGRVRGWRLPLWRHRCQQDLERPYENTLPTPDPRPLTFDEPPRKRNRWITSASPD